MILRKVDRSKYKEYMEYAEGCKANRVYPLSIACGTQDASYLAYRMCGEITDKGKKAV